MRARQLIDRSGPPVLALETMKIVYQAFDNAWAIIAHMYGSDPKSIEDARLELEGHFSRHAREF